MLTTVESRAHGRDKEELLYRKNLHDTSRQGPEAGAGHTAEDRAVQLLCWQRGDDPSGRPRPGEEGGHPPKTVRFRRRRDQGLVGKDLPFEEPPCHSQCASVLWGTSSLQRAGGRLPLRARGDSEA